jgi:hypothetical protein
MPAGLYERQISWQPSFRFPGQYQDPDMGLSATGASLFVQNHYREYMPGLARYNKVDPYYDYIIRNFYKTNLKCNLFIYDNNIFANYDYRYANNSPFYISDKYGLKDCVDYCVEEKCIPPYNNCLADCDKKHKCDPEYREDCRIWCDFKLMGCIFKCQLGCGQP